MYTMLISGQMVCYAKHGGDIVCVATIWYENTLVPKFVILLKSRQIITPWATWREGGVIQSPPPPTLYNKPIIVLLLGCHTRKTRVWRHVVFFFSSRSGVCRFPQQASVCDKTAKKTGAASLHYCCWTYFWEGRRVLVVCSSCHLIGRSL